MADQPDQTSKDAVDVQELRQSLLDQISADQKGVEQLGDEELETVVGGADVFHDAHNHFPSIAEKAVRSAKVWISRPSNQVAVGGPIVAGFAAFGVGFVDEVISTKPKSGKNS